MENTDEIEKYIKSVALPKGFRWLNVADHVVMPIYGASGGLTASFAAIIIDVAPRQDLDLGRDRNVVQERDGGRWICVEIHIDDDIQSAISQVDAAIAKLSEPSTHFKHSEFAPGIPRRKEVTHA